MITNIKKYQAATYHALNLPENNYTYNGKTCPYFSGEPEDEFGLGWYHYGARYYDPQVSRWHATDPADELTSPYVYVGNNPLGFTDPDGEVVVSFLRGFVGGLFSKDIGAVQNGVRFAKQTIDIYSSVFQGSFGRTLSRFTLELPQQALGLALANTTKFFGGIESISQSNGATLIETKLPNLGGFTLGNIIQVQRDTDVLDNLFQHEFGHVLQSRHSGPIFLGPAIISFISASIDRFNLLPQYDHENMGIEKGADRLADDFFRGVNDHRTTLEVLENLKFVNDISLKRESKLQGLQFRFSSPLDQ